MNSLELAYQLSRISVDHNRSDSNSVITQEFELDFGYHFDNHILAPSPSFASSVNSSLSAQSGNGLSRSRCAHNLSALCGSTSDMARRCQNASSYESGPKAWGYFVDTPSRWILLYLHTIWTRRTRFLWPTDMRGTEHHAPTSICNAPSWKRDLPSVGGPSTGREIRTSSALMSRFKKNGLCRRKGGNRVFGNANESGIWNGPHETKLLPSIPHVGRCMLRAAIVPHLML